MRRILWVMAMMLILSVYSLSAQPEIPNNITALDWNVDGTKLAIGYENGTIEIRDFVTGITQMNDDGVDAIHSLDWNTRYPDLLAVNFTDTVWIWHTALDQITIIEPYVTVIHAVAWNGNGSLLAGGLRELNGAFVVQIWDIEGMRVQSFNTHTAPIPEVAWDPTPGASWLTSTSLDGDTILWDIDVEIDVFRLPNPQGGIGVMWSPDGEEIATLSGDNQIRIWDASNGEHLRTYEGTFVIDMDWSFDGRYLAIIDGENINILDATTLEVLKTLGVGRVMNRVVWSINNELAFGGGGTRGVQFYTVEEEDSE